MKYIQNYFSGMWSGMKSFFTWLGWQGLFVCVMVAILLGWVLPSCAHR